MTPKLDAGNVRVTGNTLSTLDTNGNFTIAPNGTGSTIFSTLTATTVPYLDASKKLTSSAITPTQLALLGTATNANTPSTLVQRDGSGNFSAGTITAGLTGNVTGNLTGNVTGNVTGTSGSTTGNAATVTTNANLTGPITSAGNATAVAAQTGTGSTFVMQTSPALTTPDLGTPTALVGTNITGTAAGLTAGHVTTNANLTGPITSSGNATAVAAQTGTGSIFVMQASPTLTTPAINGANFIFGTASNSNMLELPKASTATLAGLTNTAARIAYDSTLNNVVYNNGAAWTAVGSGSGGLYQNFLTNPGFESGTTGWTASGGTLTTDTSSTGYQGIGNASGTWDSSAAAQTLTGTAYTIGNGLAATNAIMRCKVMTPSGTATHTFGTWDGSTLANTITIPSSTTAQYVEISFPFGAAGTTIAPRFTSVASNEPLISIDDCYVGTNFQISTQSPITDGVTFTPVLSAVTTPPTLGAGAVQTGTYRRVGDSLEVWEEIVFGTSGTAAGSGTYRLTLPNGYLVDTTKLPSAAVRGYIGHTFMLTAGTIHDGCGVEVTGTNPGFVTMICANSQVASGSPGAWAANDYLKAHFTVPIVGWQSQTAVRADNADFDPTAWTPTGAWSTNTTYTAFESRIGKFAYYDILIALAGAPTSATLTVNLPSGRTIDTAAITKSSTNYGELDMFGCTAVSAGIARQCKVVYNSTTAVSLYGLSTSTFTGTQYLNYAPITQAAPGTFANGDYIRFSFRVPIVGWTNNQRVPLLIGSVTSSTVAMERVERAIVVCSGASCSATQSGSWISSVTRNGTGLATINFTAGMFSAAPTCVCMYSGSVGAGTAASTAFCQTANPSTGSVAYSTELGTFVLFDTTASFICMGPR